jgi:hypothetical protein
VRAALRDGPQTIGALRAQPGCGSVTPSELIALLIGTDTAVPLWRLPGSGVGWGQAVAAARRFNAVAADRLSPFGVGASTLGLATPALAGGLTASAFELAVARRVVQAQSGTVSGELDSADLVARLLPPGPGPDADIREDLERRVREMMVGRLPVWQALGVV